MQLKAPREGIELMQSSPSRHFQHCLLKWSIRACNISHDASSYICYNLPFVDGISHAYQADLDSMWELLRAQEMN